MYNNSHLNKLYFTYKGPTKDVSFNKYFDSKEGFNEIKSQDVKFDDAIEKQKELLQKIDEIKNGKKILDKKK